MYVTVFVYDGICMDVTKSETYEEANAAAIEYSGEVVEGDPVAQWQERVKLMNGDIDITIW